MKYKTLAELQAAYRAGEITEPVIIDHPDIAVDIPDDPDWITATRVFKMDSCDLIKQALDLLQIPNEHG